jgi:hypothetical protein
VDRSGSHRSGVKGGEGRPGLDHHYRQVHHIHAHNENRAAILAVAWAYEGQGPCHLDTDNVLALLRSWTIINIIKGRAVNSAHIVNVQEPLRQLKKKRGSIWSLSSGSCIRQIRKATVVEQHLAKWGVQMIAHPLLPTLVPKAEKGAVMGSHNSQGFQNEWDWPLRETKRILPTPLQDEPGAVKNGCTKAVARSRNHMK